MPDRPSAREILAEAQRVLASRLLPRLPEEAHYEARMVARAMAIAERELAGGDAVLREELVAAATLYGEDELVEGDHAALAIRLEELNARLCTDIREGRFDAPERAQLLLMQLRRSTLARLRLSNPKAMSD